MKVALIGTTAGCVIGFRADMIRTLVQQGHEVYAFALDFDDESNQFVRNLGATPVIYRLSRAGLNPLSDIINTYKLSRQLRHIAPDIVFTYFSKPVIFGTIAAFFAGVKRRVGMLEGLGYVFTEQPHGIRLKTAIIRRIQVLLYKISFPLLERIIFLNSDDPVDLLQKHKISVKQYSIIGPIGLDLSSYPYSGLSINPVSFLFIGRLLAEKGIHEYLAAARIVKVKYPESIFIVLGGVDKDNPGGLSVDELNNLHDTGLIIHPGHVSNVQDWIKRSSVFVLPSYREGFPRSTQEAMSMGRPVITTDVPGCRETVIDGVNGFVIPPWNAEKLAEKMIFFIENPEKITSMGQASFEIAQSHFDAKKINAKLLNLLIN